MTLAATRRYAFRASVLLGLVATLTATALILALVGSPEQVVLAMSTGDVDVFLTLAVHTLIAAVTALIALL